MSTSSQQLQANSNLDRATIDRLLAEHRDQAGYEHILSRPGGGWLIITASHVLPDGTPDDTTDSAACMALYDHDRTTWQTTT